MLAGDGAQRRALRARESRAFRRTAGGTQRGRSMSATVYVPRDSSALSLGADKVAGAIAAEAGRRNIDLRLVRNGSRGMFWLEPMVEVETARGRVAYGPVTPADIPALFDSGFLDSDSLVG